MSKEMFNTNKAILVKFPAYTNAAQLNNTSTADIYIPFPVKQINVKGIDLDFDADFRVMYFTSNLVDNGPLGSGFGGILCDFSASTKSVNYIFPTPRDINGTYTFNYHVIDTASFYWPKGYSVNNFNATISSSLMAPVIDDTSMILPTLTMTLPGAPPARVLFILEFIGYA